MSAQDFGWGRSKAARVPSNSTARRTRYRDADGNSISKGEWLHLHYPHLYGADGKKKKNPARNSLTLKNFTGTIKKLANGTVLVKGRKK